MNWLDDVKYCAEECERQHSGEGSVYDMCFALHYARGMHNVSKFLNDSIVKSLGKLVEAGNENGWRQVPVTIDYRALPFEFIERQMQSLLHSQGHLTARDFYQEFESIHPFIDGNGRVGSLLYNWLNETLDTPVIPPEYKR